MKVKELKKWLNECDDNNLVYIHHYCDNYRYEYYSTDIKMSLDTEKNVIMLRVNNIKE